MYVIFSPSALRRLALRRVPWVNLPRPLRSSLFPSFARFLPLCTAYVPLASRPGFVPSSSTTALASVNVVVLAFWAISTTGPGALVAIHGHSRNLLAAPLWPLAVNSTIHGHSQNLLAREWLLCARCTFYLLLCPSFRVFVLICLFVCGPSVCPFAPAARDIRLHSSVCVLCLLVASPHRGPPPKCLAVVFCCVAPSLQFVLRHHRPKHAATRQPVPLVVGAPRHTHTHPRTPTRLCPFCSSASLFPFARSSF